MDPSLLEQLMTKPVAQKQEKVKIMLPSKGEIAIKTKIFFSVIKPSFSLGNRR